MCAEGYVEIEVCKKLLRCSKCVGNFNSGGSEEMRVSLSDLKDVIDVTKPAS